MNTNNSSQPVVLLVDDAIDGIRMLSDALEAENHTVLVALEGSQALTITKNIAPDIILLDAVMPHMDGFETCRRLKQDPKLVNVPIIFMTGLSDTEHVLMGLAAGGVDYVTKPINPEELVARMKVHLANARMTRNARAALDSAGHYLFSINQQGDILWATPQVHALLRSAGFEAENCYHGLSAQLQDWLKHNPEPGRQLTIEGPATALKIEYLTLIDGKEYLLRLTDVQEPAAESETLKLQLNVTSREADVLLWIAKGKTNREIGQILDLSPRTVNKHLEQIFRKLGVENRTSAAAIAIRCLTK